MCLTPTAVTISVNEISERSGSAFGPRMEVFSVLCSHAEETWGRLGSCLSLLHIHSVQRATCSCREVGTRWKTKFN